MNKDVAIKTNFLEQSEKYIEESFYVTDQALSSKPVAVKSP